MFKIDYQNISKHINYTHMKIKHPIVDFHLHDGYEIFFLISGDVSYFVENKVYSIEYGDLIITNNHEIHKPSFGSDKIYERICLEFNPAIVQPLNSQKFDLLNCFTNRPAGEHNRIRLNHKHVDDILELFYKIESLGKNQYEGSEILRLSYLIELLVFTNRVYMRIPVSKELPNIHEKLVPILQYIDDNLESDMDLECLEKLFYIDRYYLSKLFKSGTGSSIHSYIIFKRISKAKRLLSEGVNVTQACTRCGFNDYSNFLKMFKKIVGISPGKYKISCRNLNSSPQTNLITS